MVEASIRRPGLALGCLLAVTLAAAPGLVRLELATDGAALVPPDAPALARDREVAAHFDLRDPIVVYLETTHPGGIYNPDTLARVSRLTALLTALPGVGPDHVVSLATERRDRAYPGSWQFRSFLDPPPTTPERLRELRDDVAAVGLLTGTLVAADGSATALLVGAPEQLPGETGSRHRIELLRLLEEIVSRFEDEAHVIHVVGAPVAEALLGLHLLDDLTRLLPLAVAVIALILWGGCRRLAGVALGLAEVAACLIFTFGLMGWLGEPVYLTTAVLPVILTCLGLADEIHVLWEHQRLLAQAGHESHSALVRRTYRRMTRPLVVTSLTTAAGFLSFLLSPIRPVSRFGLFAAVGILFCLLWSLTVMPAAFALLGRRALSRSRRRGGGTLSVERLFGSWLTHPRRTLTGLTVVTLLLAAGMLRLQVQDGWIAGFAAESPFRRATERVDTKLDGTHTLRVHLAFPDVVGPVAAGRQLGPLADPDRLTAIGALESFLEAHPRVGGVLGPYEQLTTVAYLWSSRRPERRVLPEEPLQVRVLVGRLALTRGEDRRHEVIDDALERTVITVLLGEANYQDTAALMRSIRNFHQERLAPLGAELSFAGDVAVSQAMIPAIVSTQLTSLLLALGLAWLLVAVLYRSPVLGLATVAPAALAALWMLGLMGWARVPLGVATSMFCAVTLGVGVDYAIHYVERLRQSQGGNPACAARRALAEAGPAILADALAIASGFALLGLSAVPANARLGGLVATALVTAALLTLGGLGTWWAGRPVARGDGPP